MCTAHSIEARDLFNAVLADINRFADMAVNDEKAVRAIERRLTETDQSRAKSLEKEKKKLNKRLAELDRLFSSLYEDKVMERITERNFEMMSGKYQKEQLEIEARLKEVTETLNDSYEKSQGVRDFLSLIRNYQGLKELDATIINALIDKILVSEREKLADGTVRQEIKIYYKFIGFVGELHITPTKRWTALKPKNCTVCGVEYVPSSGISKYCPACAKRIQREKSNESKRRSRERNRRACIELSAKNDRLMLRCLQEKQPLPKVIILSAYSEFSYAQQAIKLGVSEYLIKPIMVNELTQALRMVEQQLKTKGKKKEELPELDTLGELLTGFQVGRLKYSEALESYVRSKFSVEIQGNYIMILAYLGDHYEEERKRTIPALTALLKDTISKKCQILDFLVFKSCLFIFPCEGEEAVLVKRFQKTILTRICNDSMASFGWIRFTGLSQLAESAATLQGCMDWCIPLGNGVIIHYPRIKQLQTSPLSYPVDIENQMKTAICMANPTKLQETFRDFQSYFRKGALYDPKKIKESYLRFIWSVINVAKELDLSRYFAIDQQALLESVMEAVTNEELEKNMEGIAGLMPEEKNDEDKDDNMRLVIRRTKSLIHEFYARGITLDEIAEKLNVTPEYLGSQFHKEVGVTFSTYMKEYRIQKAKKLLIGTNLKLYEVAEQVGYATPKYFSKIFKEVTGQFPAEYRKLNK